MSTPRRIAFALALALSLTAAAVLLAPGEGPERRTWPRREILDAIRDVETRGTAKPPDGDGGRAIGPYQIHEVYWRDAMEFDPSLGGSYQDCRDRAHAERVIDAYMRRWAPEAWENGEAETIARVHNGGPRGARIDATLGYWQRVRRRLE